MCFPSWDHGKMEIREAMDWDCLVSWLQLQAISNYHSISVCMVLRITLKVFPGGLEKLSPIIREKETKARMSIKCTELYWAVVSPELESITWEKLEVNLEPETHQTYSSGIQCSTMGVPIYFNVVNGLALRQGCATLGLLSLSAGNSWLWEVILVCDA